MKVSSQRSVKINIIRIFFSLIFIENCSAFDLLQSIKNIYHFNKWAGKTNYTYTNIVSDMIDYMDSKYGRYTGMYSQTENFKMKNFWIQQNSKSIQNFAIGLYEFNSVFAAHDYMIYYFSNCSDTQPFLKDTTKNLSIGDHCYIIDTENIRNLCFVRNNIFMELYSSSSVVDFARELDNRILEHSGVITNNTKRMTIKRDGKIQKYSRTDIYGDYKWYDLNETIFNFCLNFLNSKSKDEISDCLNTAKQWTAVTKYNFCRFMHSCLEAHRCYACGRDIWKKNETNWKNLTLKSIRFGESLWNITKPIWEDNYLNNLSPNDLEVILAHMQNVYLVKLTSTDKFKEPFNKRNTTTNNNLSSALNFVSSKPQNCIMENLLLWHCRHDGRLSEIFNSFEPIPEKQRRETLLWMASKLTDLRFSPCLGEPVPADQHDLSLVGGKCAFILERLLDTKIAPVNKSVPPEQIQREQKRVRELIKQRIPEK